MVGCSCSSVRPARLGVASRDASVWRSGEDVGQLLDVVAGDHRLAAVVLLAQAVDQLGAQDVDLAVQDPPPVGDLGLLLGQLPDQRPSARRPSASRGRGTCPSWASPPVAGLRRRRGQACRRSRPTVPSIDSNGKAELEATVGAGVEAARSAARAAARARARVQRGRRQRQRQPDVQQHLAEPSPGRPSRRRTSPSPARPRAARAS